MLDVLGVGTLNLDLIYETPGLGKITIEGRTLESGREIVLPSAHLSSFREALQRRGARLKATSPGGSASNTCHMLSLMGFATGLIGTLGVDQEGATYLSLLTGEDTAGVVRRGGTGVAFIVSGTENDRSIVLVPNDNSALQRRDIDMDYVRRARWIHMSSYVSEEAFQTQMEIKRDIAGKIPFTVDPGEIYSRLGEKVHPLIDGAEILFTSSREMTLLFGDRTDSALRQGLRLAKNIVVKKGGQGASLYGEKGEFHALPARVETRDTTGAGDVLNGVFIGLSIGGADPGTALAVATRAASLSTSGYGRETYPVRRVIEAIYEDARAH